MPGEAPLLIQTDRGPTLLWKGIHLYPTGDPIEYARRKARAFSPPPQSLLFVPSIGLGHGLSELLEALPPGCAVLCVEAFQEVMGAAIAHGLPRDPRLVMIRTAEPATVALALREMGAGRFRRVVEATLCAGYRLAPDLYASFRRVLEEEIRRHWRNRLTLIAMGSLQIRNLITNLPVLPRARDFAGLSTTLPVMVAAAGPSLELSLPLLLRLRDRFLLVAADTALPTLGAVGIVPDLVVVLEAQHANLQDFIAEGGHPETFVACDLSCHPSVPRLFGDKVTFFSSRFAPLRLFDRLAQAGLLPAEFPALGSVGVAAAHAALRLGSGDVFLAGLDFSYPGWRTHARGSPSDLAMLGSSDRLRPVGQASYAALAMRTLVRAQGKTGAPVLTDTVLSSYRDSLSAEMQGARERVWDAGLQGLPLGVRTLSPVEVEERLCSSPRAAERLHVDPSRSFDGGALPAFLSGERKLLERTVEAIRQSLAAGAASDECRDLVADADYAWAHFPDEPDLRSPAPAFLVRVGVAARYYVGLLERVAS